MPNIGTTEIIIIALVIVLLFGAKKIPDLMRGLGSGVREFKDAAAGKGDDAQDKRSSNGDGSN